MAHHYGELNEALVAPPGDLLTDRIEADCVQFALGEIASIWPAVWRRQAELAECLCL